MEFLTPLLVLGIFAAVVYAVRPKPRFIVRISNGRPTAIRGIVTSAFLAFLAELCDECSIRSGEIRGMVQGQRIVLIFSNAFGRGIQQRIRNWWNVSGWSPAQRITADRCRTG